jgi:hypothetical protein
MKLSFQLQGNTNRPKIIPTETIEIAKEKVLVIEGDKIVTDANENSKQLIIPLIQPVYNTLPNENDKVDNLDALAAKELLQELSSSNEKGSDNNLVIGTNLLQNKKKAPLLLANIPAEILALTDDDERFKADIALRPADMDVKSDAYLSVPIEQFGAAMLRGMGWIEDKDDEKKKKVYDITPRDNRLGLGAMPKPPEVKDKKHKSEKYEADKKKWEKEAMKRLEKQELQVSVRYM